MRRWMLLAFLLAVVGVLAGSRLARAQNSGVEICHVSKPGSGAGKIISLKEGSAALNAHKMLHGDSEDFTIVNEEARTCTCDPAADPRPNGGDDDSEGGDDDSEGDDDSGEPGDDDSSGGDDDSDESGDDDSGEPGDDDSDESGDDDSGEPGDDDGESDGDDD